MKIHRRYIRLSFVKTGESVIAEMLDDEAPVTCQLVWGMLPVENDWWHGRYSGMESFMILEVAKPAPPEKRTMLPLPGEILYWNDGGSAVTSTGNAVAEIVFAFGRGVRLCGPEGVASYANLFARIPGDWKYDWVDFDNACARVRSEGLAPVRIERME